jgi:uncharacterized membrane protein
MAPAFAVVFLAVGIPLALMRHASFETQMLDMGYYTQVIWNTAHGRLFATTLKPPTFLADHFSPLLAAVVPFFYLLPDARILLIIEIVTLATAIVPGYLLLRQRHRALAPLLVLAFVFNPLLHQLANDEFHEIMLAVPLLALAAYALYVGQLRLLLVSLLLTLLVREDMAVYVASFGLYLVLWRRDCRKQGLLLIAFSLVWFVAITSWVIPALGQTGYRHSQLFAQYGNTVGEAIANIIRNPLLLIRSMLSLDKALAVVRVFGPLAVMPLLATGEQLLWAPAVLLLLALPDPVVGTLRGWYLAPALPLLWFSAAQAIARMRPRLYLLSMGLLILASGIGFWTQSPFPGASHFEAGKYTLSQHDRIGHRVLQYIPPGDSVTAQSRLGPHLATREQLYLFPWYNRAAPPQWIVLDTTDANPYPLSYSELQSSLRRLQMDPSIQTVWEQDGYYLLNTNVAPAFISSPQVWPPWLQLEGHELAQTDHSGAFVSLQDRPTAGRTLRVILYWTALAAMDRNYSISVRLVAPDGRLVAQDDSWPGGGTLATSVWPVAQTIRDTHYLQLPSSIPAAQLTLAVLVYETATLQPIPPDSGQVLIRW